MTTCIGNSCSPGCRWWCIWWRLFCAVLFPTRCLGWDLGLNWVSFWGFSYLHFVSAGVSPFISCEIWWFRLATVLLKQASLTRSCQFHISVLSLFKKRWISTLKLLSHELAKSLNSPCLSILPHLCVSSIETHTFLPFYGPDPGTKL